MESAVACRGVEEEDENMLPEAFLERMQHLLGEEYEAFLDSFEQERYQALRVNSLKHRAGGGDAAEALSHIFPQLERVPWTEDGYYYQMPCQPGKHPWHDAGVYYIQEPSAMAPAALLGVRPGEHVLDLCAAPGGKSTQIAAALKGSGLLFCNEIHPARAKILSENIERLGIGNVCVANETPERLAERFSGYFDRILVDAPCSGEGMFRKNEAACQEWSLENVTLCAERQDEILDCAAGMLRPGGRLVYSTCTFAPEEDEGSVDRFLRRHGDFEILPLQELKQCLGLAGCDGRPDFLPNPLPGLKNTLRLWPQRIKGEGHFAAAFQKAGSLPEALARQGGAIHLEDSGVRFSKNGMNSTAGKGKNSEYEVLEEFCALQLPGVEWKHLGAAVGLQGSPSLVKSGEHFYLMPEGMPSLKGLKVLRPGLHLGESKKNRFEPSHALALALAPEAVAHRWELGGEGVEIKAYLSGQTFPAQGEPGWYLICVDGFGIGWGKLAGGIMKNHYPKGLRRGSYPIADYSL